MDTARETAARIFGVPEDQVTAEQRRAGKAISYQVVYGTPPGPANRGGDAFQDFETDFRGGHRSGMSYLRGATLIHRFFEEYGGMTFDDIRPRGESLLRLRSFRASLLTELVLQGFDG